MATLGIKRVENVLFDDSAHGAPRRREAVSVPPGGVRLALCALLQVRAAVCRVNRDDGHALWAGQAQSSALARVRREVEASRVLPGRARAVQRARVPPTRHVCKAAQSCMFAVLMRCCALYILETFGTLRYTQRYTHKFCFCVVS